MLGILLVGIAASLIFFAPFWKALFMLWLLSALALLIGHICTLSVEYRIGSQALKLLHQRGWIAAYERDSYEEFRKGAALRDVQGVGAALSRVLRALLPFAAWR